MEDILDFLINMDKNGYKQREPFRGMCTVHTVNCNICAMKKQIIDPISCHYDYDLRYICLRQSKAVSSSQFIKRS